LYLRCLYPLLICIIMMLFGCTTISTPTGRIVFYSQRDGNFKINIMSADGCNGNTDRETVEPNMHTCREFKRLPALWRALDSLGAF
jgi:hypothetical protein